MKTKCQRNKLETVRKQLGFDYSFVVNSRGLSGGGLAFLWHSNISACLDIYSQYHIFLIVNHMDVGKEFMLIGFYENPVTTKEERLRL